MNHQGITMPYQIQLKIQDKTYNELADITQKLNNGERKDLAKDLGRVFTQMSCEVLEQVFGTLVKEKHNGSGAKGKQKEAEQILDQIESALRKYMPWSISFFGNDRLKPVANHILGKFHANEAGNIRMYYSLDRQLGEESQASLDAVRAGQFDVLPKLMRDLVKIIDLGISEFIRDPKTLLKFNFIVDKTLNGVISMITSTGYKRIEKIADEYDTSDQTGATYYADHFGKFLIHV